MFALEALPEHYHSQIEVKKSKFISYLFALPTNNSQEAKDLISSYINKLRAIHPKANHFVYAYRYINEFTQIDANSSDDGEPKNTSGKPTLNVLRGAGLVNAGVVTTRYFGGTLLGVGGLVRAYSGSCKEVLARAQSEGLFVPFVEQETLECNVDYSDFSKIEYEVKKHHLEIMHKNFSLLEVQLRIQGQKEHIVEFSRQNNLLLKKSL